MTQLELTDFARLENFHQRWLRMADGESNRSCVTPHYKAYHYQHLCPS